MIVHRLFQYHAGGHFGPHLDGCYERHEDERSMLTCMLYLNKNGELKGGATHFLDPANGGKVNTHSSCGRYTAREEHILRKVAPERGLCLVFYHPILHEGGALEASSAPKYILRSDIMFIRDPRTKRELEIHERAHDTLIAEARRLEERAVDSARNVSAPVVFEVGAKVEVDALCSGHYYGAVILSRSGTVGAHTYHIRYDDDNEEQDGVTTATIRSRGQLSKDKVALAWVEKKRLLIAAARTYKAAERAQKAGDPGYVIR